MDNTSIILPQFYSTHQHQLVHRAHQCFNQWKHKLNLDCYFVVQHNSISAHRMGVYNSLWRKYNANEKFGEITIYMQHHRTETELYDTIKHELAHAICDLRYNNNCGHNLLWQRTARLLGVNISGYCC